MTLLRAVAPGLLFGSFQLHWSSARVAASTPEESYDTASPFRGRKSRLRADCCNTTAPPAIGAPQGLHWRLAGPPQNTPLRYVPPLPADRQIPPIPPKTPPPPLSPPPPITLTSPP